MHEGIEIGGADAYLLSTLDGGLVSDYFEKYFLSLTCTLYSHVSFVFELAHGCISYVCWPHEVASFFFLHKGILIALTVAFAKFSSLGLSKDSSYASHGVLLVGFIWLEKIISLKVCKFWIYSDFFY